MRWPLVACKILGRTTAKYRWFAVFYLVVSFFVLPAAILALSLAGQAPFLIVGTPLFLVSAMTRKYVLINGVLHLNPFFRDWF